MAEDNNAEKKISLEESLRRIRPLFVMLMMFPLTGMVAAMIILYMINPKNLLLMEAMLALSMLLYVVTTYLVGKRMGQIGQRKASSQ